MPGPSRRSFEDWMQEVDKEIRRLVGQPDFGTKDVADFDYRDRYDEGYDPHAVALEALKEDGLWATHFGDSGDDDDTD